MPDVIVGEDEAATPDERGLSDMVYAWGRFIDHDMSGGPDLQPQGAWTQRPDATPAGP